MPATTDDDSNGAQGPTWDDVYLYLAYLADRWDGRVRLDVEPKVVFRHRRFFRVILRMDGLPDILGEGSFGAGNAFSSRTMAGAAYRACIKGEETLESIASAKVLAVAPRKRRKAKTP